MAKVENLKIQVQSGSTSSHYATWTFNEITKTTTSSSSIKAGDYVTIKSGSSYYNGVSIPDWVMSDSWQITEVHGDRAVLGRNKSGSHNIQSPINVKNLSGGSGSSTTTSTNTLDHYEVSWYYDTGNGIWFSSGTSNTTEKNAIYSGAPENAIRIKVTVKPVAKTHKVNGKDTAYWSGTSVSAQYSIAADPPEQPTTPSVNIDKYKLTASIENISDARTDQILFEVYNGTKLVNTGVVTVLLRMASFSCTVTAGGEYRVRCRSINLNGSTKVYGAWSDYSGSYKTIPNTPSSITVCKATSETSVYLEWTPVETATSYDIEYATKKEYFDGSDQTTTNTGIEFNHFEKTGLESGEEYFFRVRAVNAQGTSSWSGIKSVIIGKDPAAPTTWSSATTVITGEPLTLYWVHNSEDGSSQTYAEVELYINGIKETYTVQNTDNEEEKDKTSSYEIDTTEYPEGTQIQWRVRTAGITLAYGDWSVQRTIDIYAPPTLELSMTNSEGAAIEILDSFPFYISGLAGPNTQVPIGYHLTISTNQGYETVDHIGNKKFVNAGEAVYSKYFDTSDPLLVELSAGNIDLENNIGYTATCVVSMNSGLTAEASLEFSVAWMEVEYEPDVEIAIDKESLIAYVKPYCRDEEGVAIEDVTLSVYRREFDGSFTELGSGLDNTKNTVITDPHPSLDYARYRIVATTISTGTVTYYDAPGYPVNEKSIVIQWSEDWSSFDTTNEDAMEQPPWSGSMLKLPYNVDVSDNHKTDVSLIKYIGRTYPVSYYGTHVDTSASWSVAIPKNDEETIYALRRLAVWTGDVYVREPSGSGYWANISVSFSQKHLELTIPVTFDIVRVVGGV